MPPRNSSIDGYVIIVASGKKHVPQTFDRSFASLRLSLRVTLMLLADVVGQIFFWSTLIGGLANFVSQCGNANQTNSVLDGFNFNLLVAIQLFIAATQDSILNAATLTSLYRQCIYT